MTHRRKKRYRMNGGDDSVVLGLNAPPPLVGNKAGQTEAERARQHKLATFGPYTKARLWKGIRLNINYFILAFLVILSTIIAVIEGLDSLYVAFRIPLINLIFHIVLFLLFVFYTLWNAAMVTRERVQTEKMSPAIVGFSFSVLHLCGTIAFIIWAVTYDGLNTRVQFTSEPIGFISLGIVSGALFVGYILGMGVWVLLLHDRYNHSKSIETINIASGYTLEERMVAAATKPASV